MTRIAVSGHRGLSSAVEKLIADEISHQLRQVVPGGAPLTGLSCLADGADQLFASLVLNHGGTLEVVIPAAEYRDKLPEAAKPEYDRLISRASAVHRCPHQESTPQAHMDASRLMVDSADRLFAVWDGERARSYGGTADVVDYARREGVPVVVIWPAGAHRD